MSIIVAYCKIEKIYFYLLYENRNNKIYNSNITNLDNKNKVKNNFQLKIEPFDNDILEIIKKCIKESEILEI